MTDNPHKWVQRSNTKDSPVTAVEGYREAFLKLLAARGLKSVKEIESFLNPSLKDIHDPLLIPGIKEAVKRLRIAVEGNEKILIFGDYDADGLISAALLYNFLADLDITADIHIPDRVREGYDLGVEYIRSVAGKKDLVICVDCGTNNTGTQEYIMNNPDSPDVIALDHHNPTLKKYNRDKRYIVANPKLPGSGYPFMELSGAGVAFKFITAVLRSLDEGKKEKFKSDYLNTLLDMVAVSTLADVMPLCNENRIMVKKGIERIQDTVNMGLKALIEVSMPEKCSIGEYEIGFILAPKLNAVGRLKDAMDGFRLLAKDEKDNARIAGELDTINKKRQKIQKETYDEIISGHDPESRAAKDKIFIEYSSNWSEGILGIVASDMVKAYNMPAILLRERGGILKGSGRSIPEFGLHENLKKLEHLFMRFGGHDLACGITMEKDNFEEFRDKMAEIAGSILSAEDMQKKYKFDMELGFDDIDMEFAEEIQMLRPFGNGNSCPSFITRDCTVGKVNKLKGGRHAKMSLYRGNIKLEGILFNMDDEKGHICIEGNKVDILYTININSWRGTKTLQLVIRDLFQKN